jgi:hypothetical protein
MQNESNIRFFGYLGLIASIMVGIGEFLLHFPPISPELSIPYDFFLNISEQHLSWGHYLVIPFVPLYIFGYWHLYLALRPGSKTLAKAVLTLGIFAFVIGGMWISSRAHLGIMVQELLAANASEELQEKLFASYDFHIENLVQILRVIVLLLSIVFVWAILKGGTLYPKWMAFFTPVLPLAIVFALFFGLRPIGQYLIPTAMNIAHFLLFAASLWALRKT